MVCFGMLRAVETAPYNTAILTDERINPCFLPVTWSMIVSFGSHVKQDWFHSIALSTDLYRRQCILDVH